MLLLLISSDLHFLFLHSHFLCTDMFLCWTREWWLPWCPEPYRNVVYYC